MMRNLIVSSLTGELSSEKDIFLGEWAIPHKKKIKEKDFIVLPYHWDDSLKAHSDSKYLSKLRKKLVSEISYELNKLHRKEISEETWNLMIGFWLISFLGVAFDRWTMLKVAVNEFDNLSTKYNRIDIKSLIPSDSREARKQFGEDYWNHAFINHLITYYPSIKVVPLDDLFPKNVSNKKISKKDLFYKSKEFAKRTINQVKSLSIRFLRSGENVFVITDPALSFKNIIKLRLGLKGITYYQPNFPSVRNYLYEQRFRNWTISSKKSTSSFETMVREIIPQYMPTIFLEGFKRHFENKTYRVNKIKPNIIFTSYQHLIDDSFKIWASRFLDKETKLIAGCHGGGVPLLFHETRDFESEVCDFLLVTGSSNTIYPNSVNVGQYWGSIKSKIYDANGPALIIQGMHPRYLIELHSVGFSSRMLKYFKDQFSFYNSLPKMIRKQTKVRLYPAVNYGWNEKQRWRDNCSDVLFADNKERFDQQVGKCRISIVTYNATTSVELLSANIPVIIFWDENIWQSTHVAEEDFKLLKKVGIFHSNHLSAVAMLEKVWNDIDLWWSNNELQLIKNNFCKKYGDRDSFKVNNIIEVFEKALNS